MRKERSVIRIGILFIALALLAVACQAGGDEAEADLPEADASAVMDYVTETSPYTEWGTWPNDEWNSFNTNLVSGAPHGNVVRIYVNEIALDVADGFDDELPEGSMIVKENYVGNDPESPGELDALTIMYKVEGFNAEANDWFWVKAKPDGSQIDAEGAVDGCIGCHSQEGNQDYVLRYGFGDEPAVTSLSETGQ